MLMMAVGFAPCLVRIHPGVHTRTHIHVQALKSLAISHDFLRQHGSTLSFVPTGYTMEEPRPRTAHNSYEDEFDAFAGVQEAPELQHTFRLKAGASLMSACGFRVAAGLREWKPDAGLQVIHTLDPTHALRCGGGAATTARWRHVRGVAHPCTTFPSTRGVSGSKRRRCHRTWYAVV